MEGNCSLIEIRLRESGVDSTPSKPVGHIKQRLEVAQLSTGSILATTEMQLRHAKDRTGVS